MPQKKDASRTVGPSLARTPVGEFPAIRTSIADAGAPDLRVEISRRLDAK